MEIKKTVAADLERRRTRGFLLGLAVATLIFFAALQIPISNDDMELSDDMLNEIVEDMEMMPAVDQHDQIALEKEKKETVSDQIKEVDKEEIAEVEIADDSNIALEQEVTDNDEQTVKTDALPPIAVDENDNPLSFRVVEQLPDFPGGMVEFMKWLTRNLKYPEHARRLKIQGTVMVSFIVNKDGSISDIKLKKSADDLLDKEALRIMKMMPNWKAGEDHGKPCRTMIDIPIVFKL